jgi:hypothetical protein
VRQHNTTVRAAVATTGEYFRLADAELVSSGTKIDADLRRSSPPSPAVVGTGRRRALTLYLISTQRRDTYDKAAALIFIGLVGLFWETRLLSAQQRVPQEASGRAQVEMFRRIEKATTNYARQIDISENYIAYCHLELHIKTYAHPRNGHIPFGIDYNSIADQGTLDRIISARENYETSFIILCLAKAKKTLADAR